MDMIIIIIIGVIALFLFILLMSRGRPGEKAQTILTAKAAYFTAKNRPMELRHELRKMRMAVSTEKILITTFITIGMIYGLSLLVTKILGVSDIKIGYLLMLFIVGFVIYIVIRLLNYDQRGTSLALHLISLLIIIAMFFVLPKMVPQMFSVAMPELKTAAMSLLGMP